MSAVRALDSVACAAASDHLIELKSCQWLSDDTGQIQKHRIVLNILPQSAFVYCLQNLRQCLVAAIGDAQSFSDRVHYFHLSFDGPSTQVELASSVVTLSAQQGAIDNESDTDSSTATLLLEGFAQQKDAALDSCLRTSQASVTSMCGFALTVTYLRFHLVFVRWSVMAGHRQHALNVSVPCA